MNESKIRIEQYEQAADRVSLNGIKWERKWDVRIQCDSREEADRVREALTQRLAREECPECNGTGMRDSGGFHPWGEAIAVACDCKPARQEPVYHLRSYGDVTKQQLEAREEQEFIKHEGGEDGWCEWVCPDPESYLMKCCDCGLVHEVQMRVAKYEPRPSEEFVVVDDPDLQAQWRMRRYEPEKSPEQEEWTPDDMAYRPAGLPARQEQEPSTEGPEELWLQLHGDCDEDDLSEPVDYTDDSVTWCWHQIFEHDVRYVRADLAGKPAREEPTRAEKMREAGYTRRPTLREFPSDEAVQHCPYDTTPATSYWIEGWQARAALEPARQEQEPVALPCCGYPDASAIKWNPHNHAVQCHNCGQTYTAPQPREFVGLSDGTITHMAAEAYLYEYLPPRGFDAAVHAFARAIEAKLKERNA